jgi:hypothetical protein
MPGNPQPLIFSAFLPAHQMLLDRISNETNSVMSFDPAKLKLVTHEWYMTMAFTIDLALLTSMLP